MSDSEHAAALLALVNAQLNAMSTPHHAYEMDKAPTAGGDFVTMDLSRRDGASGARLSGVVPSPTSWRVIFRAVGIGVSNARFLLGIAQASVEGHRITVDGVTSTPLAFEPASDNGISQDDYNSNLWTGQRSFTYSF